MTAETWLEPSAVARPDPIELQRTLYGSRNPTRRWLHTVRLERISAEIRRVAERPDTDRVIEIGPGIGPCIGLLCDLFAEVVAADVQETFLRHLDAEHGDRPNLTLVEDDVASSRLEEGSFDLVLCSEVIEHTADPAAVLLGIARLLRPRGTLILSTPQAYSTVELLGRIAFRPGIIRLVRAVYREPVLPTGHVSLLTRRRLGTLLEAAGLRATGSSLSGLYLPVVAETGGEAALRLEQRLAARLEHGPMSGLLWTQHWTAERIG